MNGMHFMGLDVISLSYTAIHSAMINKKKEVNANIYWSLQLLSCSSYWSSRALFLYTFGGSEWISWVYPVDIDL